MSAMTAGGWGGGVFWCVSQGEEEKSVLRLPQKGTFNAIPNDIVPKER